MVKYCKKCVFFALPLLFFSVGVSSQSIGNPKLGFQEFACATKGGFNSFEVKVSYSGYRDSENYFILELSDSKGSFADKTKVKELKKLKGSGTSTLNFNFSFPEGVFGEQYRVRVRSTHPKGTPSYSGRFAAYYLPSARPVLNNKDSEVFLCGSNATKELQVTFEDGTDASIYKYMWFKDEKPFKEGGSSFLITGKGVYSAKILLEKGCANNVSESNWVEAKILGAAEEDVYINNKEEEVGVCANESYTFKANVSNKNYEYRWYKDKKIIKNSSLYLPELTVNSDLFGVYYLLVKMPSGCEIKSQEITLKEKEGDFKVAIDGAAERSISSSNKVVDLQLSISKKNGAYAYQWFKDKEPLLSEKDSKLSVSTSGEYFVKVTEGTADCSVSVNSAIVKVVKKESEVTATVISNILSPFNADGINDLWILPKDYRNATTKVVIYDVTGKEVFSQSNYQNNWPEEASLVKAGALYYFRIFEGENIKKSGTISIVK